jgi:hypothetical protein
VGDQPWHRVNKSLPVPNQAREAIFRIGLFGGTGQISFDSVTLTPVKN